MELDLSTLTNRELVGIHNGLNPDHPLKHWKGKKTVLVDRIEQLRGMASEEPEDDETSDVTEAEPVEKKSRTIRSAAIDLLCATDYHESRDLDPGPSNRVDEEDASARSVGFPYDHILTEIFAEFPECKTTVACLRWYSVKIRVEELGYEGLQLPQRRPRVKSKKAA